MGIDTILRSVLMTLEDVHVIGKDARKMAGAMDNIQAVINAVNKAKEEEAHAD